MTAKKNRPAANGAASQEEETRRDQHSERAATARDREALRYFDLLFCGDESLPGYVELRAKEPDGPGIDREFVLASDGSQAILDALRRLESYRPGWNLYNPTATMDKPGSGKKGNLRATRVLHADHDRYGEDPDESLASVNLMYEPSLVVASGGPGAFHSYLVLKEPVDLRQQENVERVEAINRGSAHALGADRSAVDATHILRPPGTTNYPDAKKREKGRIEAPVRLVQANESARYSIDDFPLFEKKGRDLKGASGDARADYERREVTDDEWARTFKLIEQNDRLHALHKREVIDEFKDNDNALDQSYANHLAIRGVQGHVIEEALKRSRDEHGAAKGSDEKHDGYWTLTVGKALAWAAEERRKRASEAFGAQPGANTTGRQRDAQEVLRSRSGLIDGFLSSEAPPIEWVIEGLIPAGVEGGIVAAGGTGKGLFEMMLAIHVALGVDCGPFRIPKPRGVVILALEDDVHALHRRFRAALDAHFPDLSDEQREALRERVEIKPLRGARGANLCDDFVNAVIEAAAQVPDVGLIFLDPLTRGLALPEGKDLNSQEGGGITINQLGRIAEATGASVVYAHHVTKQSRREGTELHATAATGSAQLVDLSRVVINMSRLTHREAEAYSLDPNGHRYVELRVSKTNGPEPEGGPFVLEVLPTGAVEWRTEAHGQALTDMERVFAVIERLYRERGEPVTRKEILAARGGLGENRVSVAWNQLVEKGAVARRTRAREEVDPETGRASHVDGFEPAADAEHRLAVAVGRDGGEELWS